MGSPWFAQDTTRVTRVWQRDLSDWERTKPGCFSFVSHSARCGEKRKWDKTHTHSFSQSTQPHCEILHHRISQEPKIQLESSAQFVEEKSTVSCKTQKHKSGLWARNSPCRECQEWGGCSGGNVRMCLSLLAACSGCPCTDLGQASGCFLFPCSGVSLLQGTKCFGQNIHLSGIRVINILWSPQWKISASIQAISFQFYNTYQESWVCCIWGERNKWGKTSQNEYSALGKRVRLEQRHPHLHPPILWPGLTIWPAQNSEISTCIQKYRICAWSGVSGGTSRWITPKSYSTALSQPGKNE